MEITLTVQEAAVLKEVLENQQRELLREISRSRHHEFTRVLREKENCLNSLINKLNTAYIEEAVLVVH